MESYAPRKLTHRTGNRPPSNGSISDGPKLGASFEPAHTRRRFSFPAKAFSKSLITSISFSEDLTPSNGHSPSYQPPKSGRRRRFSTGTLVNSNSRPSSSRRASQEMITYTAGEYNPDFVSVLPPEKTKAWHFSSHEKALIRAGIDPRQFSCKNIKHLRDKFNPRPAPETSVATPSQAKIDDVMATLPEVDENEEITSYTEHIPAPPPTPKPKESFKSGSMLAAARKVKVIQKTWLDDVQVNHQPFVDYFKNIKQHPTEYLNFEELQKRRRMGKSFAGVVQLAMSSGLNTTATEEIVDNRLVVKAAYSLDALSRAPKKNPELDNDINSTEYIAQTDLEKSRYKLQTYLDKLSTAQIIKAREMALKELGYEEQSMSNWSRALKGCSYIRPIP